MMGAHIYPFPAPPADRCRALAPGAELVADRLAAQHGPVLATAAQLLALDDATFAVRLDLMRDAEGGALVHDLATAFKHASADLDLAGRALFLVRARLAAGIATYGGLEDDRPRT